MTTRPKESNGNSLAARRFGRDWTQGNIFKNLLLLSWPMAVTQSLMTLGPTIDMIWVGRLGPLSIAAVGISGVAVQLAQGAMMGLTTGMRALIARFIGSKDMDLANRVAQQAIVVSMIYSIIVAIIGGFYAEEIISLITKDPEIVSLGGAYLRIQFVGSATMSFRMMMDSIMQASGDSMNPMQIAIVFRIFHIILCPFMIFGLWIFPELGVKGAAYTSVISQSLGVILGLRVLFGDRSRLKLSFKRFHFDFDIIWRIVRIGFPSLISGIQRNLNQMILQRFLAPFGTLVLAAHTITQRLEMLIMMPAMAIGMGAGVLAGQNLGAKQPDRAEKSAWTAVLIVEVFAIIASLVLFVWTTPVIRIFNSDPSLDETATQFLHIAIVGWLFIGFMFVLMSCLQGTGDTIPTMIISIITTWLITLPFAYFLPKWTNWGVIGIRWAMTASTLVGGIANVIYFRTGKWKTRMV
jgi:putative MATE family efflux protein